MFKTIRQYKSYTSKNVMAAAYILFPAAIFVLLVTMAFFGRNTEVQTFRTLLTTFSIMVSVWASVVVCLSDRFNFGAFLSDKSRIGEIARTSSKGIKMIKSITLWDIFSRLLLIVISSAGIAVAGYIGHPDKGLKFAMMCILFILTCHLITSLLVWICRMIENQTISTLIYSFGILYFFPVALIFMLPEEIIPSFIYTGAVIGQIILDVIVNSAGMLLLNRFIKREWYNDGKDRK